MRTASPSTLAALVAAALVAVGAAKAPAAPGERWVPPPAWRAAVPVLNYHGITNLGGNDNMKRAAFASQMKMLDAIGAHTISARQFAAFVAGRASLPSRPVLITFDDGRTDSWTGADDLLRRYGFRATMFVIANKPGSERFFLSWRQLRTMAASGRWDLEEHAGAGHTLVRVDEQGTQGPYYAYRTFDPRHGRETFAHWRRRVTGDISWGAAEIARHVPGFRAALFALPYGNYGQEGTNDPRIAAYLSAWLVKRFAAIFIQEHPAFATAGTQIVNRLSIHDTTTADELYAWLAEHNPRR
jgi:peptidoglycan/xylan/chitin deacetylase (PgdA/CDA1 family)